jgi:hypothetical protein
VILKVKLVVVAEIVVGGENNPDGGVQLLSGTSNVVSFDGHDQ